MTDSSDASFRHRKRMQAKKKIIDAKIAQAQTERGVLLVLTGDGKGKSTSAFGMIGRALGHGLSVGVAQFIKGRTDTGEEAFFSRCEQVAWHVLGEGFTWETQDLERDKATAAKGWKIVQDMLREGGPDVIIIDELTYPLRYGWLDTATVINELAARPAHQHVVITGRAAPAELVAAADTVSTIAATKHAYNDGIMAQPGIDW